MDNRTMKDVYPTPSDYDVEPVRSVVDRVLFIIAVIIPGLTTAYHWSNGPIDWMFSATLDEIRHQFVQIMLQWGIDLLITALVYVAFYIWTIGRADFKMSGGMVLSWDLMWLSMYLLFMWKDYQRMVSIIEDINIGRLWTAVNTLRQLSLMFKVHSFVRTCSFEVLQKTDVLLPTLSSYLYFMWAPTLVYKHSYPRTTAKIRWTYIGRLLITLAAAFFSLCFYIEHVLANGTIYHLWTYSKQAALFYSAFWSLVLGFYILVTLHFCVFHCVCNIQGEILGFGTRQFYQSWWISPSFVDFMNNWNKTVNPWLKTYICEEVKSVGKAVAPKYTFQVRLVGVFATFLFSAVLHDYVAAAFCNAVLMNFTVLYSIPTVIFHMMGKDLSLFKRVLYRTLIIVNSGIIVFIAAAENIAFISGCQAHLTQQSFLGFRMPSAIYC